MTKNIASLCALFLSLPWLAPTASAPAVTPATVQDPVPPTAEHVLLGRRVGSWDAELLAVGPDGREQRTRGTLTTTKLTDWHTVDAFTGEFLGMRMLGHGVHSWCPVRKLFLAHWVDSMSPAPMLTSGSYDPKTNALTMTGECFGIGGVLAPCRTVTQFVDDDHMTWTFFGAGPDGREMQHLHIVYTRRK